METNQTDINNNNISIGNLFSNHFLFNLYNIIIII